MKIITIITRWLEAALLSASFLLVLGIIFYIFLFIHSIPKLVRDDQLNFSAFNYCEHTFNRELTHSLIRATVRIRTSRTVGSGIVLKSHFVNGSYKTYVLTAAHVIAGPGERNQQDEIFVDIFSFDQNNLLSIRYQAQFEAINPQMDCGLISINTSIEYSVAKLASLPQLCDQVYATGVPDLQGHRSPDNPVVTSGNISAISSTEIRYTALIAPGYSGGGIFSSDGQLVGIIRVSEAASGPWGNIPIFHLGRAIPTLVIKKWLHEIGIVND